MSKNDKKQQRDRRIERTRAKVFGTTEKPRLAVFKSLKHIYVQLIDDSKGATLVCAHDGEVKKGQTAGMVAIAKEIGKIIGQKAREKGIKLAVLDRRWHQYHGQVQAIAEGAREAGLGL